MNPLAAVGLAAIAVIGIYFLVLWIEVRKHNKKRCLIVKDQRKWLSIFLVLLMVGCSSPSEEPDTLAGAESVKITFPTFPALPAPPGTSTSSSTTTTTTTKASRETGTYWGVYNGGRPQWYFKKKMSQYPKTIKVVISGCITKTISNNGSRYEGSNGFVAKQSEVSGRGMAVVGPYGCASKTAYVEY